MKMKKIEYEVKVMFIEHIKIFFSQRPTFTQSLSSQNMFVKMLKNEIGHISKKVKIEKSKKT